MLTQLFLAARREGSAPLPYAREAIRSGLAATAERLNAISPDLATQFTHSQALRPPVLLGGVYPERRMIAAMLGCRDFFISFNQADRTWATWIAWVIEAAGYSVFFQNWDFKGNFVLEVDRAHTRSRDQIRFGSSARYECLTRMYRSALDRVAESLNTLHSSETNE